MFQKIEMWVLYLTIILSTLFAIGFGTLVRQELVGHIKAGRISKAALFLAEIPMNLKKLEGLRLSLRLEDRFPEKAGFTGNPLERQTYLLLSRYDGDFKESVVELVDLKNFEVVHTWNPDITHINSFVDTANPEFKRLNIDNHESRARMRHPLLTRDGDLIFLCGILCKINNSSNLVWQNHEDRFHHSIEFDAEGNIWVPTYKYPYGIDKKYVGEDIENFWDDAITKVSPDGEILFQKSVSKIFKENGLESLLFSVGRRGFTPDPLHLNDIQPVLQDSLYWKTGDVFLSIRHQSMILLYRPSTNEIIWRGIGPFFYQHDIDILNDHQILVFNNNSKDTFEGYIVDGNNEVIIYDFKMDEYTKYLPDSLVKHDVRTSASGTSQLLNDGDLFIEESHYARILYFNKDGSLRWEYVNRASNDNVYPLFWSRILYKFKDVDSIKKFLEKKALPNE